MSNNFVSVICKGTLKKYLFCFRLLLKPQATSTVSVTNVNKNTFRKLAVLFSLRVLILCDFHLWVSITLYWIYIYLGSSVCHISVVLSSCHPVILASCHNCGTLCYSFSFNNQTDQGYEREGFEREGYRWRDRRGRDWRGRVWIDFSLFKPNLI